MPKGPVIAVAFMLGFAWGIGGAKELKVVATPSAALYGEPFSWKVTGFRPGERVRVKAASKDARMILWESEAVFEADASGAVDMTRQAPVSGGYREADIFGLLWSMKPTNSDPKKPIAYRHDGVNGWTVDLTATNSVGTTATTRFRCVFQRPGEALVRVPLEKDGLRGFLYLWDSINGYISQRIAHPRVPRKPVEDDSAGYLNLVFRGIETGKDN